MTALINTLNSLTALVSALLLFCTGGINALFNGNAEKCEYSSGTVGLESLTRAQGVTNDGRAFIFSGKSSLERVSFYGGEVLAINTGAITPELKEKYNSQHIGGISCCDGIIYAPLEDSKEWNHPVIALYDAETLEYSGRAYELPKDKLTRGVPWVAIDGENGFAYTGDSRNYTEIYRFTLPDFSYDGTITLDTEIEKIQGGEVYGGFLYAGTNDITRAVYKIDLATGGTEKLFDRIEYEYRLIDNFGGEGEDLTVIKLPDGTSIHTLQTGALFIDVTLRHYKYDIG